jgi:hypothetical protein
MLFNCPTWLLGLFSLAILAGSGISALCQDTDMASAKPAAAGGGGQYFIEFRARYAWDYGHTFIVHGRVGEPLTKASVAGLSPVGDDATAWVSATTSRCPPRPDGLTVILKTTIFPPGIGCT